MDRYIPKRSVPQRSVPQRTILQRTSTTQTTQISLSDRLKQQQQDKEYKTNIDEFSYSALLSNVENINQLSSKASDIYNSNLSKIDVNYQNYFRSSLNSAINRIKSEQNTSISQLQSKLNNYKNQADYYKERYRYYRDKGDTDNANSYKASQIESEAKEFYAQKYLNQYNSGDLLDYNSVLSNIISYGKSKKYEKTTQQYQTILRKEAIEKQAAQSTAYQNLINTTLSSGKVSYSSTDLQKNLNITKQNADNLLSYLNSSIQTQKDIKSTINQGATYTKEDLNKVGLTSTQVNDIIAYQNKQTSKTTNLFDTYASISVSSQYLQSLGLAKSSAKQTLLDTYNSQIYKDAVNKSYLVATQRILPKSTIESYLRLSNTQKNQLMTYSVLKTIKDSLPSQKELDSLKNITNQLIYDKVISSTSKNILKYGDLQNFKYLNSLSDKQLQNMILNNDLNKLNLSIDSFNKYTQTKVFLEKQKLSGLVEKYKEEISIRENPFSSYLAGKTSFSKLITQSATNYFFKKLGIEKYNNFIEKSKLIDLQNKIKNNQEITQDEYLNFSQSLKDVLGIKTFSKNAISKIKNNYGSDFVLGTYSTIVQLLYHTKQINLYATKAAVRDVIIIGKLLAKGIYNLGKWTGKTSFEFGKDLGTILASKINKLPIEDKNKLFAYTKKNLIPIIKTKDFVKNILNNPEILILSSAFLISNTSLNARKTLINNPDAFFGEIASFFIPDLVGVGVQEATKFIKTAKSKLFDRKVIKLMKEVTDPNLKSTDWVKEALEFRLDNQGRQLIDLENGVIIKYPSPKVSKQLTLLPEQAIQIEKKTKTIDTTIDILENNMILKKVSTKTDDVISILSPRKEFNIEIIKTKTKTLKQTKLADFNADFSKLKIDIPVAKFTKPNRLLLVEKDFSIEVDLTRKALKQSTFDKLFSNKKGQIALLDSQDKKNVIDIIEDVSKKIRYEVNTLKKITVLDVSNYLGVLYKLYKGISLLKDFINSKTMTKLVNQARIERLKPTVIQGVKEIQGIKQGTKIDVALAKLQLKAQDVTLLKSLKTLSLQDTLLKQDLDKVNSIKKIVLTKQKLKTLKLIIPEFNLNWNKPLPKGYTRVVNVLVREKGKVKEIKLKTTPKRALKYITSLVDNTTSRSFDLKTIGVTKKKDINTKISLNKFRYKAKNSPVLQFVEKSKYAIDTQGEKRGLKLSKLLKQRRR